MAGKLEGIQVGRALAALSVAYFHSHFAIAAFPGSAIHPIPGLATQGYLGVNFFFAISGFVICLVLDRPSNTLFGFTAKDTLCAPGRHSPLRPLIALGDASYSLYLVHWMVFMLGIEWSRGLIGILPPEAWRFAMIGLACGTSLCLWHAVERPFIRIGEVLASARAAQLAEA